MRIKFKPPKGTKDLLPDEFLLWLEVFKIMRKVVENFGYQPIETPAFESFELLAAKSGEEIKNQIYCFKDKAGRKLGLRFDLTVPVARIVASNPQFPKPIKWYYISKMWRYEKPKEKGLRYREFWQLGIEYIGVDKLYADAEVILIAIEILKALGLPLEDFKVFLNNKKFLEGVVISWDVPRKNISEIIRIIDKKDKLTENELKKELNKVGLKGKNIREILKLIKLVGEPFKILRKAQKTFLVNSLTEEGLNELKKLCKILKEMGIIEVCNLDLGIARGMDYYTDTIFEVFEIEDGKKVGSSIVGGGRYDNLIEVYGGKATPAVGWGMGIERLIELLKKKKLLPIPTPIPQALIIPLSDELVSKAFEVAQLLRKNAISSDVQLIDLKKGLKYANKKMIPFVIIIGPKEFSKGKILLKRMRDGKEITSEISVLPSQILEWKMTAKKVVLERG